MGSSPAEDGDGPSGGLPTPLHARARTARVHRDAGRWLDAESVLAALVPDAEALLGPDHPCALDARSELLACQVALGRSKDQVGAATAVVADCLRVLGEQHPTTVVAKGNLAAALSAAGRPHEALELLERLLVDVPDRFGPEAPQTFAVRANAALAARRAGRLDAARHAFEHVVVDAERVFGPEHPTTLSARLDLGDSYRALGRSEEARAVIGEALARLEAAYGVGQPATLGARSALDDARLYDGPWIADRSGQRWLWVTDGTIPSEERFGWPRPISGRYPACLPGNWVRSEPDADEELATHGPDDLSAAEGSDIEPSSATEGGGRSTPEVAVLGAERTEARPVGVEVRVLGPVEVVGWRMPPERGSVVELLCFLALHRSRAVRGEVLRVALRPDGEADISAATLRSYLSHLRRALGPGVLPPGSADGYRLGPGVGSDWERFISLSGPGATPAQLVSALALVRGRPFQGAPAGTFAWVYAELLVSDMEVAIVGAARRLGEKSMAAEETDQAEWATRQGLVGAPMNFSLWRLHLAAASRRGRAVLDRARREAVAALGIDADQLLEPTPPEAVREIP